MIPQSAYLSFQILEEVDCGGIGGNDVIFGKVHVSNWLDTFRTSRGNPCLLSFSLFMIPGF